MPFVDSNLLLSHWVYLKTILQATSYEKTAAVSRRFPAAPGQRPSGGARRLRRPGVTAHSLRRAAWWAPRESRKVLKPGPRGTDSCGGGGTDERQRAGGEEAHF